MVTGVLCILLVISILLYDWIHKWIAFSPLIMALCRFFLFLTAASASDGGVTGLSVWTALALASYIVGLSYVAKAESTRGGVKYWPCFFLLAPLLLAWLVNQGEYKARGLFLAAIVALWIVRNLQFTYWSPEKNIGRSVSGLLAGIVLVDLLALSPEKFFLSVVFLLLFGSALFFQRFIPAT
jgi:4-hydroxybenzoate polyprenyltransferase